MNSAQQFSADGTGPVSSKETSSFSLLFQERYAMAQSQKNLWTKLVSTWKCVEVSLSSMHVRVRLHGLFGLLVKPFGADLDHLIPVAAVVSASKRRAFMGYDEISLAFNLPEGGERELLLYLKRGEEFLAMLNSMK